MKVLSNKLKNVGSHSSPFHQIAKQDFSVQAAFVQRWNKINQEALLGGG